MNPRERKQAQEDFRTSCQICVATEAAGEGINLQFCHLMINYDLPWNPTRLEQRLGRIHRIGQSRDVYAFNFVATSSEDGQPVIEGRILERLLSKLERMKEALGDRVFDVVGEVLSLNRVNLRDMLREVAYEPRRLDDYLDAIERIDPGLLSRYEQATGIALAHGHVDFSSFAKAHLEAEERRLMPRYVESHFLNAAKAVGLRTEARADGLWRIEHVLAGLRSERLATIRRLGKPDINYRKLTFYKEHLEEDQHLDAVLFGPGHPLYAAVDERLKESLQDLVGQSAVFVDSATEIPYRLHFHEISVRGQTTKGEATTVHAELVAVREQVGESVSTADRYDIVPADTLIDLPAHPHPPQTLPEFDHGPIGDYVKTTVQMERRQNTQTERGRYANVAHDHLKKSFDARVRAAQDRVMGLRGREPKEPEVALARQRAERDLNALPEANGLPRPDRARVAVIDGKFFNVQVGKRVPGEGFFAKTIWGWITWALAGMKGYEVVRAQDEARVAPGADILIELLKQGPSLILLDEMLEYLISAGGVPVEKTTLRSETLSFLKRLTVAVGNVGNAALVFLLQSSKRESLEYTSLLDTVEHLAARKDQRRELVAGNEILNVIQRRLLSSIPDQIAAARATVAHRDVFTQTRRAYAESDSERQLADDEGLRLRDRIKSSYPFHPELIDIMRERWAAIPEFQCTRGALRFLASCLRSAHRAGHSRILLGPGDVLIQDPEVRLSSFKEVGQREDFQPCLEHDFVGANARTRRIDERRALEVTSEAGKSPTTRIATTILMSSFGGLRRSGGNESDLLPPGISETHLLRTCVGPDLDSTTVQACLKEIRETCLYLHFDGARYCFKKDPNVTLLVEQEVEIVSRDKDRVRTRIKELIEERLAGQWSAVVWPSKARDIPDKESQFLIAYMSLEFAAESEAEQRVAALDMCENYGNRTRDFRNGLGIAVPSADQIEVLRRAVRYLIAIERIQAKWWELNLTSAQKDQLKERKATEKSATESALLKLYGEVWLPRSDNGSLSLESVSIGGRPLQTTLDERKRARIHQRLMELLSTVQRKIFGSLAPGKILSLYQLGEDDSREPGLPTSNVVAGFFSFLGFPRLSSDDAVRKAIARGVETGLFGYTTGHPRLGDDGLYRIDRTRVAFERTVADDEIDLDSGFLILPKALPKKPVEATSVAGGDEKTTTDVDPTQGAGLVREPSDSHDVPPPVVEDEREVAFFFTADRSNLYTAWNALANLADLAGEVSISAKATSKSGFDRSKLENGVLEPLRELGLIDDDQD